MWFLKLYGFGLYRFLEVSDRFDGNFGILGYFGEFISRIFKYGDKCICWIW